MQSEAGNQSLHGSQSHESTEPVFSWCPQRLLPIDGANDLFYQPPPSLPTTKLYSIRPYYPKDEVSVQTQRCLIRHSSISLTNHHIVPYQKCVLFFNEAVWWWAVFQGCWATFCFLCVCRPQFIKSAKKCIVKEWRIAPFQKMTLTSLETGNVSSQRLPPSPPTAHLQHGAGPTVHSQAGRRPPVAEFRVRVCAGGRRRDLWLRSRHRGRQAFCQEMQVELDSLHAREIQQAWLPKGPHWGWGQSLFFFVLFFFSIQHHMSQMKE